MYYISGVFLKKVKDIRERKKKLNCGQKLCLMVFYTVIYNSCLWQRLLNVHIKIVSKTYEQ